MSLIAPKFWSQLSTVTTLSKEELGGQRRQRKRLCKEVLPTSLFRYFNFSLTT